MLYEDLEDGPVEREALRLQYTIMSFFRLFSL